MYSSGRGSRGQRAASILPKERGVNTLANPAVRNLATVAARRTSEALAVNAQQAQIWRYRLGRIACTCSNSKESVAADDVPQSVDPMQDLNTPDPAPVISPDAPPLINASFDATPSSAGTLILRGSGWDSDKPMSSTISARWSAVDNIAPDTGQASSINADLTDETPGNYSAIPESSLDESNLSQMVDSLLNMRKGVPCSLCGGTGKIDSYVPLHHLRQVILPSATQLSSESQIDESTEPFTATGPATLILKIPVYWIDVTWFIGGYGTLLYNGSEITLQDLDAHRGESITLTIESDRWSHVEFMWRLIPDSNIDMPQIDEDSSLSGLENYQSIEFELDPSAGAQNLGTLIWVPARQRLYKISRCMNKRTAEGYIWNVSGSMRVLQPTDAEWALIRGSYWTENLHYYRGVESADHAGSLDNEQHLEIPTSPEIIGTGRLPPSAITSQPANNQIVLQSVTRQPTRFDQAAPQSVWTFVHNFGYVPDVQVYLADGERIWTDVDATTTTLTVTFAVPTSGYVMVT